MIVMIYLLLNFVALLTHGLTAGLGGSTWLSVIDSWRDRSDDGPNLARVWKVPIISAVAVQRSWPILPRAWLFRLGGPSLVARPAVVRAFGWPVRGRFQPNL